MNKLVTSATVHLRSQRFRRWISSNSGSWHFRVANPLPRGPCQLLPTAGFHSTPPAELAVRRRRRPSTRHGSDLNDKDDSSDGADVPKNPLQHSPITDDVQFVQAASALFDKLEVALAPMQPLNETFIIGRSFGDLGEVFSIDLGPKNGKYRIEMSLEEHMFEYTSPVSGKFLYVLSEDTGEWVGIDDGHLFEGMIVRDLIRQCQGLPKL